MSGKEPGRVRCAIYSRKSSDEGLGQQFNSLEAQRAGGEAFIESRKGQGWVCLPERYDDGGFSGGNMDRPGLVRLLADIEAGRVDCVIVYKIDRLTRSIRDFGRILEAFDRGGVTIAAVTQAIDTGDSMGRLMVHVLMSFAQFERELASERTRDKIAASRKKGIWTGGRPVLGYDYAGSRLVVNEPEAETVRAIFDRYLDCQSLRGLAALLDRDGVRAKRWTTRAGREVGGGTFTLTAVSTLLSNRLYLGQVTHGESVYEGQHTAIVDEAVFRRVQELLAENRVCGASLKQNKYGGLLKRILICGACGAAMTHSSTTKRGKGGGTGVLYRYYSCRAPALAGRGTCGARSVPAEEIERFVVEKVRGRFASPEIVGEVFERVRSMSEARIRDARMLLESAQSACAKAEGAGDEAGARRHARRAGEVAADLARLEREAPTRAAVEEGLREFGGVWRSLSPRERAELLRRVVRCVRFDAGSGELTIERHEGQTDEEAA